MKKIKLNGMKKDDMLFLSLDFIYVPARDFEATLNHYLHDLDGQLIWKVRSMGTIVAQIKLSSGGPAVLLAEHLEGVPILIYRVKNFKKALAKLKAQGLKGKELEIPHGPCFSFKMPNGVCYAIYELVRPEANSFFKSRIDS